MISGRPVATASLPSTIHDHATFAAGLAEVIAGVLGEVELAPGALQIEPTDDQFVLTVAGTVPFPVMRSCPAALMRTAATPWGSFTGVFRRRYASTVAKGGVRSHVPYTTPSTEIFSLVSASKALTETCR